MQELQILTLEFNKDKNTKLVLELGVFFGKTTEGKH
jgi:hypothetical protein